MVGITAEGYGWDFVWQNFQFFISQSKLWYAFPILMLLVLFTKKKEYRLLGFYPYLIFGLTVCNPFLIGIAGKVIGLSDRYYRFFWILPLGLMMGLLVTWIIGRSKWKVVKGLVLAVCLGVVIIFGNPAYYSEEAPEYMKKENDFYSTDMVVDISKEFHKHGLKNPKVAYPDWMVYEMCQYDPNVISLFTREEIPALIPGAQDLLINAVNDSNYELIVKCVYLTARIDLISSELFHEAVKSVGIDYFVIPEDQKIVIDFYETSGCELTGEVDGYYILHML